MAPLLICTEATGAQREPYQGTKSSDGASVGCREGHRWTMQPESFSHRKRRVGVAGPSEGTLEKASIQNTSAQFNANSLGFH